jgi:hypothetical protein
MLLKIFQEVHLTICRNWQFLTNNCPRNFLSSFEKSLKNGKITQPKESAKT